MTRCIFTENSTEFKFYLIGVCTLPLCLNITKTFDALYFHEKFDISVGVDFKAVRIPQEHGGREAPGDTPISTQKKLNARTQSRPRSTNSSGGPSRTPRSSKNGI